jgi:hypothetical protein
LEHGATGFDRGGIVSGRLTFIMIHTGYGPEYFPPGTSTTFTRRWELDGIEDLEERFGDSEKYHVVRITCSGTIYLEYPNDLWERGHPPYVQMFVQPYKVNPVRDNPLNLYGREFLVTDTSRPFDPSNAQGRCWLTTGHSYGRHNQTFYIDEYVIIRDDAPVKIYFECVATTNITLFNNHLNTIKMEQVGQFNTVIEYIGTSASINIAR